MRYAQIRKLDISNGENIGIALFVQGCHFHCLNCFNPETWDFSGGNEWTEEVKNKFIELANRPYIKRISILGGEPLAEENLDGVLDLVNRIRLSSPQKPIWLYTGYTFEEIVHPTLKCNQSRVRKIILSGIDVLIDGQYIDSERDLTLHWRGSLNQRIWKKTKEGEWVIYQ